MLALHFDQPLRLSLDCSSQGLAKTLADALFRLGELKTGDEEFDREVWIKTETPALAQGLLANESARTCLLALVRLELQVTIKDATLQVTDRLPGPFEQPRLDASDGEQCWQHVSARWELAEIKRSVGCLLVHTHRFWLAHSRRSGPYR